MSWYSNVLSATSKSISSLKSTLLASEADGDTDDDTHVCRVLRAYYSEKGRPLPSWLPPDPKAPPPPSVQQSPNYGASRYGGLNNSQPQSAGSGGGLSSLWASDPAPQQQQVPSSLRAGRGAGRTGSAPNTFGNNDGGRPGLPSQRSYQSGGVTTPPPGTGGGTSAGDRLRQRLYGGGGAKTASPAGNSAFPPPSNAPPSGGGRYGGGGGGGNGGGDYEDRFAPGGMYDGGGGGYGGRQGNTGGSDKPFVAANAPWASGENELMGGGAPGRQGGGLPGGPRRHGLPSGPRMR